MDFGAALRANGSGCHGVMAIKPTSFVQSFVFISIRHAQLLDNVSAKAASEAKSAPVR
jgi:hypothetical protein